MKVLKFGGTSVENPLHISLVKDIITNEEKKIVIVVSAFGGITDLLLKTLDLATKQIEEYKNQFQQIEERHFKTIKELLPIPSQSKVLSEVKFQLNLLEDLYEGAYLIGETTPKLTDKVVSFGELLSSYVISEYFKSNDLVVLHKDSRELIRTDGKHGKANVKFEQTNQLCEAFIANDTHSIVVVPGFVAATEKGETTTLGRGGSDYTAAIIANAINAELLEIWTDVSGVQTANPKFVRNAKTITHLSYEEAMELSHFGAKVIYPPTIQPVLEKGIPIEIRNTFEPNGLTTLITKKDHSSTEIIKGISHIENIALLSLEGPGMVGVPGISKRLFEVLSLSNINVVLITQASSEHSICFGIDCDSLEIAMQIVNDEFYYEIKLGDIYPVISEKDLSIIALIGDHMKNHQGLSGKMFSTLGKNNVNIRAIAQGASERNISAVINTKDIKKALNVLHEAFFEDEVKQLNLFVIGVGNVGGKFINQIKQQQEYLRTHLKLNIRVIGLSNSKTMAFDDTGIDLNNWEMTLKDGDIADKKAFFRQIKELNYRNSIFVDNTANEDVSLMYHEMLKNSISVVTCNKIACSANYENYMELKELSRAYNAPFLFETNVGAGLPIIDTLKHLITSGDQVLKIQAVLSGSLNFVFNHFTDNTTFSEIVKQAQAEGYTEPDPKIDLSGIDVMRKILILARESGYKVKIEDIKNNSFLPEECLQTTTNDAFYRSLEKHENHFQNIYKEAKITDSKLKYVAQFENGTASVGLQKIPKGHDFYNLEGSDNIVLFFTERYKDQPLIIKGAGAGAEVTASGIFADIIRIGNY